MTAVARRERIVLSRRPALTAEQLAAVRGNGIGTSPSVAEIELELAAAAARALSGAP